MAALKFPRDQIDFDSVINIKQGYAAILKRQQEEAQAAMWAQLRECEDLVEIERDKTNPNMRLIEQHLVQRREALKALGLDYLPTTKGLKE